MPWDQPRQPTFGEALGDLKREIGKVYGPPALRVVIALNDFLLRHPPPRWLDGVMTALAWPAEQFLRFCRWLWRY